MRCDAGQKSEAAKRKVEDDAAAAFRFQFKGLYPALEEASRLSPRLRGMLEHLVGEIDCSECGGSRLRDDAAAVRFRERTLDQIGRTPLGELLAQVDELEARRRREERSPAS